MCGRIRQAGDSEQYGETVNWNPRTLFDDDKRLRYNVPPGTRPLTLHRLGDGTEQVEQIFWGYKPAWYKRGPASKARLDTVLKGSPFWKPLLTRRILVPAEGWYEWTGDKGDKQPWFIHAKYAAPILMAGIATWKVDPETPAEDALELLSTARPESAFVWYQVTRAMGTSRYQLADASEPITP